MGRLLAGGPALSVAAAALAAVGHLLPVVVAALAAEGPALSVAAAVLAEVGHLLSVVVAALVEVLAQIATPAAFSRDLFDLLPFQPASLRVPQPSGRHVREACHQLLLTAIRDWG